MHHIVISRSFPEDHRDFENQLAEKLVVAGYPVLVVPHLYHVDEDDDLWNALADDDVVLSWLYPRATQWVLKRHGIDVQKILDLKEIADIDACLEKIAELAPVPAEEGSLQKIERDLAERWYPVVDYSRCVNCRQCMQFCLFGVYELNDAGTVTAVKPNNCKPGCPACSRICPKSAIMFPLYSDQAIAGAPGQSIAPDPKVKKVYYKRTGKPCPVCGGRYNDSGSAPASAEVCTECGLPLESAESKSGDDDLDSLIDDLEKLR